MKYTKTGEIGTVGEILTFHWDVPWLFSQTFHVCNECGKVKVLTQTTNDNRSPLGGYRKEKDGETWSGSCDYAKISSSYDKFKINHPELQAKYRKT
jgi:hypothetical protein